MKYQRWIALLLAGIGMLSGCVPHAETKENTPTPVPVETAFVKAVWVPYMEVETLLSSDDAAGAIAACMQDIAERGCNTVYFHVRANADAYYASTVFASDSLAATLLAQDIDPLRIAVEEAHARGLAIHAWINPYRIGTDIDRVACEDVFEYNGRWYFVPTSSAAQALIVDGVREVVENYAVDGVQFDDYFYPEGAVGATAAAFEQPSGTDVAAWRRENVTALIRRVQEVCHSREGCVFGVSPSYDIARNREQMYADVETWMRDGYVDYICPQLYVGFQHEYAPFAEAVAAWKTLPRASSVALIGGLALYKTGMPSDTYAGVGRGEWAAGGAIIKRQAVVLQNDGWDGIALYSHQSFAVTEDRDAAIVEAECAAVQEFLRDPSRGTANISNVGSSASP